MKNFTSRYTSREYEPFRNVKEFKKWKEIGVLKKPDIFRDIKGTYIQVSSNPQFEPSKNYHWFDGDGMVHAIKFLEGKVYYKCAFVETKKYKSEKKAGKNIYPGLTSPINKKGIFLSAFRILNYLFTGKNPFPDTSNTDVVFHNGKLFSLWFLSGDPYELDLNTLKTIGPYKFPADNNTKQLKYKFAAHPKICPNTGELFFMDFSLSWKRFTKSKIYVGKISKDGKLVEGKKIEVGGPRVLHDLVITENYIIVADLPIKPSFKGVVEDKGKVTKFGVLPRDINSAEIKWFKDTSAYNILHFINAYEENETIIVDGLKQDRIAILPNKSKKSKSDAHDHSSYLNRWTLHIKTGELSNEDKRLKLPFASEFPTINKEKTGHAHTYSYLTKIAKTPTFNYDGIIKYHHINNTFEMFEYPKNLFCSEVQFVSKDSNSKKEDDGYLLSWVHVLWDKHPSRVHVFDAQNIKKGPINELIIPNKIPIGFHTEWIHIIDN